MKNLKESRKLTLSERHYPQLWFNMKEYLAKQSAPTRFFSLDWDNMSRIRLDASIKDLLQRYRLRSVIWRRSANREGYHVKLELSTSRPQKNGKFELPDLLTRLDMQDDFIRIYMDAQRPHWRRNLLWSVKVRQGQTKPVGKWHRWIPRKKEL